MGRNVGTRLIRGVLAAAGMALTLIATAGLSAPQGSISGPPLFSPGEIIVTLQPGQTSDALTPILTQYGARIIDHSGNAFKISLPSGVTPEQVMSRQSQILAQNPKVKYVSPNYLVTLHGTPPNDLYYPDQYAIQPGKHLFAPQSWDLLAQLPGRETVVAVIDSGVRTGTYTTATDGTIRFPHPDLVGHLLVNDGVDLGENDRDPAPDETDKGLQDQGHGTHVSGIIAAVGNNSLGVCGLARDNVWILPVKVSHIDSTFGSIIYTYDVVRAINYCAGVKVTSPTSGKQLPVSVINMSLGSDFAYPGERDAIINALAQGIVTVASSGNHQPGDPNPGVSFPAAYPESIAVGAVDDAGFLTNFTNFGPEMSVVAPGLNVASTIWDRATCKVQIKTGSGTSTGTGTGSTNSLPDALVPDALAGMDQFGNGYVEWSGTSMSAPYVAAVAAILRTIGTPVSEVRGVIERSAVMPTWAGSAPSDLYGFGEVNLRNAILESLKPTAVTISPARNSYTTERRPIVKVNLRQAAKDSIRVTIDGRLVIGPASENPEITDITPYYAVTDAFEKTAQLAFPYTLDPQRRTHIMKVSVAAQSPLVTATADDSLQFVVSPNNLAQGWHMFAVPYSYKDGAVAPEVAFAGTSGSLYRWSYANDLLGHYAKYSWTLSGSGSGDAEASLVPPSLVAGAFVKPVGQSVATPPAGAGYWLFLGNGPIRVPDGNGASVANGPYEVGVQYGWNMVGNPFPFAVGWNSVLVEYAGERLTAAEAAAKGWISDSIFRWDSALSDYKRQNATSGVLPAWESEWVRVKVRRPVGMEGADLKLILAPNAYVGSVN